MRQDAALLPVYATPLRRVWHSGLLACLCSLDPPHFSLIYMLLYAFLRAQTKKIEQALDTGGATAVFSANTGMDRGLNCFVGILGADIAIILCSGFVTALQDYTKVIVAVKFLSAGISAAWLCVVAFTFGCSFFNVFYPTNPALPIALGLADIGYREWFRWSGKFQLLNLVLTGLA